MVPDGLEMEQRLQKLELTLTYVLDTLDYILVSIYKHSYTYLYLLATQMLFVIFFKATFQIIIYMYMIYITTTQKEIHLNCIVSVYRHTNIELLNCYFFIAIYPDTDIVATVYSYFKIFWIWQ